MSVVEARIRPKSSAPGQYLGYALQPVRFCYHLLLVPDGYSVSLEHLDDVAVHATDGTLLLEQTKSALTGNPLADRSVELWKTLANWAELCTSGLVAITTTEFRIYVTPINGGEIATSLHSATTDAAAEELLAEFKKFVKKGSEKVGCNPHVLRFLGAGDEICVGIIRRFQLVSQSDPIDGIRETLQALLPSEVLDQFCDAAIGIAKAEADKLIRDKKAAQIDATVFRRKLHAFVQKHNLSNLLLPTTGTPSEGDVATLMTTSQLFVRQLEAVEASPDLLVIAVSDFLRTTADKIGWAADGRIVEDSLDELNTSLERYHKLAKDEVEDVYHSQTPAQRGRTLYRRCIATQLPLEGRTLPSYFVPGVFNILANVPRIGWHPDYDTLFQDERT